MKAKKLIQDHHSMNLYKLNFIKICLIIFTLAISANYTHAQKNKKFFYDKESECVVYKGEKVAKLVRLKANFINTQKNFSLQNLEGEEFLFVKYFHKTRYNRETRQEEKQLWFRFTFIESGGQVEFKRTMGLTANGLLKFLDKKQLLMENGSIDANNLEDFIMKNNGNYLTKKNIVSHSTVTVKDGKIYQDEKFLGKFIDAPNEIDRVYHVYNRTGEKICMATIPKIDPIEWSLKKPDGANYTIIYEGQGDGIQLLTYLAIEGWFD